MIVLDLACAWHSLVDANQMENAILNLAVNARDAMPGGGRLTIATRTLHERVGEADTCRDARDYVVLEVRDNGAGMAPEVREKASEPFVTTKGVGLGTGLGLSQVYGFATQCGGTVRLMSEVGKGTSITLHIPRVHPVPASRPPPSCGSISRGEARPRAEVSSRPSPCHPPSPRPDRRAYRFPVGRPSGRWRSRVPWSRPFVAAWQAGAIRLCHPRRSLPMIDTTKAVSSEVWRSATQARIDAQNKIVAGQAPGSDARNMSTSLLLPVAGQRVCSLSDQGEGGCCKPASDDGRARELPRASERKLTSTRLNPP